VTVGHDDTVTVKNDRKTEITHDRREHVGNDETLIVDNDRKMSVKGKQEHTTTGDHISLVKGTKSLEVKGDLAQKISGALGFKVQGDIVLESSSRISLKVGGFDIHPGGVDIVGAKINLNGGGSPGDVIKPLPVTELGEYKLQFHFTDDDDVPYANTKYIAYFADSSQINGVTDAEGFTTTFTTDKEEEIKIRLICN
jgi:type VI secretion system secreted protein VgrG